MSNSFCMLVCRFCTKPGELSQLLSQLKEETQPEEEEPPKNTALIAEWSKSLSVKEMSAPRFNVMVKNTLVDLEVNIYFVNQK